MKISVFVPATSANLGPGFDCMGIALDLWNEIHAEPALETTFKIEGFGEDFLPRDESNLIISSMRLVFERFHEEVPPLAIHMINRIPIAAMAPAPSIAIFHCLSNRLPPFLVQRVGDHAFPV